MGEGGKDFVAARMIGAQPLNFLIVGDEVNIRKILPVCLEKEGHKVFVVSNFQDALSDQLYPKTIYTGSG